jgi:hypothetical protein
MIKNIVLVAMLLVGMSFRLYSQDKILLKNGEEINAIVNEIDTDVIKYKKFENPNGPLYTIEKKLVFMVKYQNGTKDVFSETPELKNQEKLQNTQKENIIPLTAKKGVVKKNALVLSDNEVRNLMADNLEALNLYNSGQKQMGVGLIFGYGGLLFPLTGAIVLNKANNEAIGIACLIGGVACLGTSMAVTFSGRSKIKKSVIYYNAGLKPKTTSQFGLGVNQHGIALVYKF